jgi:uncharacterized protein
MSLRAIKCLTVVGSLLLVSLGAARAQAPSPEAMTAARELVTTLKLSDQYKALLPVILLGIKPGLVQDRPEIERDYNAMMPAIADAYTPYYNAMINSIAKVYAESFSVDELHQITAFYREPVGQKYLQKSQSILRQGVQIGEDTGRKAAEDLKAKLTQLLREKGHKL